MDYRKRTKYLFLMGLSMIVVFVLAACSGKENKPAETPKAADNAAEPLEFSLLMETKFINWMKDLNWLEPFLKASNAKIKLVEGGDGDAYRTGIDLKVASDGLADASSMNFSQMQVYGAQGALTDLAPIIEKHAPNIKKYLEENPKYTSLITSKDGKIYGLTQIDPMMTNVTFYRADMFQKAGITQAPTTIDELTNAMRKLKTTYADTKDYYPFLSRGGFPKFMFLFEAEDGIRDGKVYGNYNKGRGYDLKSPGFKQMMEWYVTLYEEKLIDPEWIRGSVSEEAWQTKMLTGKGAISDDFFTRPAWFMLNGGKANDPNFKMAVMAPTKTPSGKVAKRAANEIYNTDRNIVVPKSSKKAVDVIKLYDFAFSEKGRTIMHYGVEGESYKVENGNKVYIVDPEVEGAKQLGTKAWTFLQERLTFVAPADNTAYYSFLDPLTKSFANDYITKYTQSNMILKYTAEQEKLRNEYRAKVNPVLGAGLVDFVTKKRSMSEWEKFVTEIDALGYSEITKIDQQAYDAMK